MKKRNTKLAGILAIVVAVVLLSGCVSDGKSLPPATEEGSVIDSSEIAEILGDVENISLKACVEEKINQTIVEERDYNRGHVLIGFEPATNKTQIESILALPEIENYSVSYFGVIQVKEGKEFSVVCKLSRQSFVEYVMLDYIVELRGFNE